jgi:hypothetical protein
VEAERGELAGDLEQIGEHEEEACDAVNVVASAPAASAPCTAPAAPPSDCISTTSGTPPHRLVRRSGAQASACSPIADAGVIG